VDTVVTVDVASLTVIYFWTFFVIILIIVVFVIVVAVAFGMSPAEIAKRRIKRVSILLVFFSVPKPLKSAHQ
jgi:TctA family transporter